MSKSRIGYTCAAGVVYLLAKGGSAKPDAIGTCGTPTRNIIGTKKVVLGQDGVVEYQINTF